MDRPDGNQRWGLESLDSDLCPDLVGLGLAVQTRYETQTELGKLQQLVSNFEFQSLPNQ